MTAQAIKAALNCHAQEFAQFLFPAGKKFGNEWLVGSLAGEPGKSLAISISGNKLGVWSDFATAERGSNLLELYIQTHRVDCGQAIKECADWLGSSVDQLGNTCFVSGGTAHKSQAPKIQPGEIYSPTDDECQQVMAMIERMRDDAALRERVAKVRDWKPETIRQLALEGYLGWHHGKIAFIYDTGVKLRWRENGQRIIRWAFGKPWIWRGAHLSIPQRTRVYLTEGESDCIALLDIGLDDEGTRLAVAIPSASSFDPSWACLFRGKDVVLCFDGDAAGDRAAIRVSALLQEYATSVCRINWEGLRHAC